MKKRFLEMRVHKFDSSVDQSMIVSIYRVDLYTLAIGPIHHSIELQTSLSKYFGKLSCDIIFSQMQQAEIKLSELHCTFYEHYDEAYNVNFNVITFSKIYESNKSKTKLSRHN